MSVILTLRHFRCYESKTFEFPLSSPLQLLKGPSGKGKSTILSAFAWVLYGGMQHIYPRGKPNVRSSVELQLPQMTIYRQKRPELLRVSCEGKNYEGTPAQSIIHQYFGTKEVWWACNYMDQGERNILLRLNGTERLQLLQQLTFSEENPDMYLEKIQVERERVQKQLEEKKLIYQQCNDRYEDAMKQLAFTLEECGDLTIFFQQGESYERELEELERLLARQYQYQGQYQLAQQLHQQQREKKKTFPCLPLLSELEQEEKQLARKVQQTPLYQEWLRCKTELEKLGDCTCSSRLADENVDRLQQLYQQALQVEQYRKRWKRDDNLLMRKTSLEAQLKQPVSGYTEKERQSYLHYVAERNKHIELAHKLQLPYEREKLTQALEEAKKQLASLPLYEEKDIPKYKSLLEKRRKALQLAEEYGIEYTPDAIARAQVQANESKRARQFLKEYKEKSEQYIYSATELQEQIQELEKKKSQLQLQQKSLTCPHCRQLVYWTEGRLEAIKTLIEGNMEELETEKERIQQQWREAVQFESMKAMCEQMEEQAKYSPHWSPELFYLEPVPMVEQVIAERKYWIVRYQQLVSLCYYEAPTLTLEEIEEGITEREKRKKDEEEYHELKQLSLSLPSLPEIEEAFRYVRWKGQKERYEQQLQHLLSQLDLELGMADSQDRRRLQEVQKQKQLRVQYEQCEQQLYAAEEKMKEIATLLHPEYTEQKQTVLQQYGDWKRRKERLLKYEELQLEANALLKLQRDIDTHIQMYTKLVRLWELGKEIETSALQYTIDTLNMTMNELAVLFFEDPITLRLSPFKVAKTTEKMKPSVNLTIHYQGAEYDNIQQLSGGEGDRISLLLTLALSQFSAFPFLLLDEVLASLDANLREQATKIIRLGLQQKNALCILHEGTEGYYDSIHVM